MLWNDHREKKQRTDQGKPGRVGEQSPCGGGEEAGRRRVFRVRERMLHPASFFPGAEHKALRNGSNLYKQHGGLLGQSIKPRGSEEPGQGSSTPVEAGDVRKGFWS